MGFESLLIIVVVVEAVWIISSLFRGSDDDRKALQRRPVVREGESPNPRERPPMTNVDRFLEEINRRRREAAERQAGTGQTAAPAQNRSRAASPRPERPPQRRPGSAPVIVATPPVPAAVVARQSNPEVGRDKRRSRAEPLEVELDMPASALPPGAAVAAAHSVVPATPSKPQPAQLATPATLTQTRRPSLIMDQLLPLLRNRRNLPAALALNEILGPPLSRRSPRSRRKIL
jgi:hypothetical protein